MLLAAALNILQQLRVLTGVTQQLLARAEDAAPRCSDLLCPQTRMPGPRVDLCAEHHNARAERLAREASELMIAAIYAGKSTDRPKRGA
jgi:hypothetical protein